MKKNRDFFHLQYDQLNWKNQEKTGINSHIHQHIIQEIILKHQAPDISIFDIGFGIGYFIRRLGPALAGRYEPITLEATEPARMNYDYYLAKVAGEIQAGPPVKTSNQRFLAVATANTFDFITAIYVFPHLLFDELPASVEKIHSMLKVRGKFVLVLANEKFLEEKLGSKKDLVIESGVIEFNGKNYAEIFHYSDIPEIGRVVDCHRGEAFYEALFANKQFALKSKTVINDHGFLGTVFVFQRE